MSPRDGRDLSRDVSFGNSPSRDLLREICQTRMRCLSYCTSRLRSPRPRPRASRRPPPRPHHTSGRPCTMPQRRPGPRAASISHLPSNLARGSLLSPGYLPLEAIPLEVASYNTSRRPRSWPREPGLAPPGIGLPPRPPISFELFPLGQLFAPEQR